MSARNQKILDLITKFTLSEGIKGGYRDARRLAAMAFKSLNSKNPLHDMKNIANLMNLAEEETRDWMEFPEDMLEPGPSPIDACDLRFWLFLAEQAGVPTVPAHEILVLTEDEFSAVSGKIEIPEMVSGAISRKLSKLEIDTPSSEPPQIDEQEIRERLFTAMDDVPAGWMVRSNFSACSVTKTGAGTGLGDGEPSYGNLGPDLQFGPGFINVGNRRCINVQDDRIIKTFTHGHRDKIRFYTRPWITASRFNVAPDIHRQGTPLEGNGRWPCEWRVFVENGKVRGVSSYYMWSGQATQEDAQMALEAKAQAEKIIEKAKELQVQTRLLDIEVFLRKMGKQKHVTDRFPREDLSCCLDFIETEEGLVLLEGGPAHTPIAGAYPCGFIGHNATGEDGCDITGVAFRMLDNISIMDPSTWKNAENNNCILGWDEVYDLANGPGPSMR